MPTYSYQCKKCSHVENKFHGMSENPRVKCSQCGGGTVRLLGTGAGLIFKGSGFYETDYKKSGSNGKNGADGKASESKSEGKSESKSESKADAKTDSSASSKKVASDSSN